MTNKAKEQEIWKQYPEFDFIEVSNLGRVRTKDRYVPSKNASKRLVKGRVLKQHDNGHGYMFVQFYANGKRITLRVNRMVAITYIPNPHNYPVVNHLDNDRANNAVSNLEWCTRKENEDYKKNFGTSTPEVLGRPVIVVNPETSEVFWFESQSEAARQLGVYQQNINHVVKGLRYTASGYWFCDADENAVEKTRIKFGDEVAKKVEELLSERKII